MKVLVTGATGFIGKYVVDELVNRNISVVATARRQSANYEVLRDVTFIEHDIELETDENIYQKFGRPNLCIHLAWPGLNDFKSDAHLLTALPAQKTFLNSLVKHGLDDLTITGTCLEYGLKEGELHEGLQPDPVISYPQAKNALRLYLTQHLNKELNLKWVRLFYMYGKGQSPKSILSQLDAALNRGDKVFNMSKGDQKRDYLPVKSVAENIVIFALQKKTQGIINCCSGQPITVKQLVQDHLRRRNKEIELNLGFYPYPDYEPFQFWGNPDKQNKIKNQ